MKKEPRCFAFYLNDRICDICCVEDECLHAQHLRFECQKFPRNCKFKEDNNEFPPRYLCTRFNDKFYCDPELKCIDKLYRLEKLKNLSNVK